LDNNIRTVANSASRVEAKAERAPSFDLIRFAAEPVLT
jgi:hypothetical protein